MKNFDFLASNFLQMRFAENLRFQSESLRKVWQSYSNFVRKTIFHQISVYFLLHPRMKHHKSGIYAIPFGIIYKQCTLPTVPAIEDDCIQQAVLRKLPPVVRSPGAATCAKPLPRCAQVARALLTKP